MDYKWHPKTPDWVKPIIIKASQQYNIPTDVLSSQLFHESNDFNPKARNQNSPISIDRGLAQINSFWHPDVSDAQADDPNFAVNWLANNIAAKYKKYGGNGSWTDEAAAHTFSEYNTGDPVKGLGGYAKNILSDVGRWGTGAAHQVGDLLQSHNQQPQQSKPSPQESLGGMPLDPQYMKQGYAAQANPKGGIIYSPPKPQGKMTTVKPPWWRQAIGSVLGQKMVSPQTQHDQDYYNAVYGGQK